MSHKIGFGTYRITYRSQEQVESLIFALQEGVDLIDTSTNYMNGEAELAVALALNEVGKEIGQNVEVVSKYGYIQGSELEAIKQNNPFTQTVFYSQNCYHNISPAFMQDQLEKSLSRLHVDCIDCYLIHNPEYFMLDYLNHAKKETFNRDYMQDEMLQRIFDAFMALEQKVQEGKIKSYGISSNAFAKHSSELDFLEYEPLIDLAQEAAHKVGSERHHFTTIELPINLLEQEGLKCASWAKQNGLRVLSNRPLNAQKEGVTYRLATYEEPSDYYLHLNGLIEMADGLDLEPVVNMCNELDSVKHKFLYIGDFDMFYIQQIVPLIRQALAKLDENSAKIFAQSFDLFINSYKKMVAYECTGKTKEALVEELDGCNESLQKCALNFLHQQDDIDYILVGMRRPSYVSDVL